LSSLVLALLVACSTPEPAPPPPPQAVPVAEVIAGLGNIRDGGSVAIADKGLDDQGLATVLADHRVAPLGSLTVTGNRLTPAAVDVLAASDKLAGLTWLNLSGNPLGDEGAARLAAWSRVGSLHHLFLSATGLGATGVAALAPRLGALEQLALVDDPLGDEGATALTVVTAARLDLRGAGIGGAGARALIGGGHAGELALDRNPLGGGLVGLGAFAPGLRRLDLEDAGLTGADLAALAAIPDLADLRVLHLSGNAAGDEGVRALAAAPWLSTLEELHVEGTGASKEARDALVEAWTVRKGLKVERR
jgi:hypothetical protein